MFAPQLVNLSPISNLVALFLVSTISWNINIFVYQIKQCAEQQDMEILNSEHEYI